jgi:hypothetical protein
MKIGTIVLKDNLYCLESNSGRSWFPLDGASGIAHDFRETFTHVFPSDLGKELHRVGGVLQMENNEQRDARLAGEKK